MNRFLTLAAAVILVVITPGTGHGQPDWPAAPIRLVVPFPGGSAADVVARLVTDRIAGPLGQAIVVEARPAQLLKDEMARWKKVVKEAHIVVD